jgi:hypothetical protein
VTWRFDIDTRRDDHVVFHYLEREGNMARFSVPLEVEVEAENADAAFAYVRTYYTVTDHYALARGGEAGDVQFMVQEPQELREDEFVIQ